MRQKRAKTYRKLMSLYSLSFGFRQPYQVLVDSEFCKFTVEHKLELLKQLSAVLQGTVKPMITQCCIHELYLQGESVQAAVDLAKTFERRKCNHREAIVGEDCLASVVGDTNKHRYVLATQSQALRSKLRDIPAVPIVHINRSVMILEPPSDATIREKARLEQDALRPSTSELAKLPSSSTTERPTKKKHKGPKGPNPLSVKKKKTKEVVLTHKDTPSRTSVGAGSKRKREGEVQTPDQETDDHHKRKRRRRKVVTPSSLEDTE